MYKDDMLPEESVVEKMNFEYGSDVVFCEVAESRQMAELEEIYELLKRCETFLSWLEGRDISNADEINKKLSATRSDIVLTLGLGCKRGLDYRYCCNNDFNKNCCDYCKCEMELMDKIIKILTLKNSIADKQCMMKLLKNRMDVLQFVFNAYAKN